MKHLLHLPAKTFGALLTLLLLSAFSHLDAQTTYYVDASKADNAGAGTSWAEAKKDLQDAINLAANGDAIWVKAGTYKPTQDPLGNSSPADSRDLTFFLKDGVKVYGGFSGTETLLSQRNVSVNITTLSGDIGLANDASDNCYHVALAVFTSITETAWLDGFTITGGNANGAGSLTVNTISINRNSGGGIYTRYGANSLTNNTITTNAASSVGAGIFSAGNTGASMASSNNITNNTILANVAGVNGGGIYMVLCTNTLDNNIINSNTATNGAGVFANGGFYTVTNNTISNNTASANGGGLQFTNGCTNTVTANSIINNTAGTAGGGLYSNSNTNSCINNVFSGNGAASGGGIYLFTDANDAYTNNTVYGNTSSVNGGGLFTNGNNNAVFTNNIFWANTLGGNDNTQGADYFEGGATGNSFSNNLLQLASNNYTTTGSGAYDLGSSASANIFATDPLFVNASDVDGTDNVNRTADDGLRLQAGSPAINSGSLSITSPSTDIIGATRGVVPFDLGAYEWFTCSGSTTLYVDASAPSSGSGYSWGGAFKTLDEALFVAQTCTNITTINVAAGTYKPSKKPYYNGIEITSADSRDVTFYLRENLSLYGGFPSGGGQRNPSVNTTILSGDLGTANDASDNAYHVVVAVSTSVTPTALVDGFTITGGNANGTGTFSINGLTVNRNSGGGVYTRYGANTISNNIITSNAASAVGGGIYNQGGPGGLMATSNTITNNTISNNTATSNGGGIYSVLCTNAVSNNSITGNTAANGGGLFTNGGTHTVSNNSFSNNTVSSNGGGIQFSGGSTCTLTTNTIDNNTATGSGGGLYSASGTITSINNVYYSNSAANGGAIYLTGGYNHSFTNNTVYNNTASVNGGGLFTNSNTNAAFTNNIFWANTLSGSATTQGADYYEGGTPGNNFNTNMMQLASSTYTFSGSGAYDLGASSGGNIFSTNPLFVNTADPDGADNMDRTADDGLRIPCSSPATESGSGIVATTDILNNTRNGSPDIGAYESNGTTALTTMPSYHVIVSQVQPAALLDYTDCMGQLVKIDGSNPYTVSGPTTVKLWIESSQPANYVERHYEITPLNNAATASGKITLFFTQAEFDAFNAVNSDKLPTSASDAQGKANLRIHKYSGASSDGSGLPSSYTNGSVLLDPADDDIVWNSVASRWEVSFSVTGFSGFFVETVGTLLPLHWLSITGKLNGNNQPEINWSVEETNVAEYVVEKTTDRMNYTAIGTEAGKGNGRNNYSYTEPAALQGIAYYRIKQIDADGKASYSSSIRLSETSQASFLTIYPNPVRDAVSISVAPDMMRSKLQLMDVSGRVLKELMITNTAFTLDMSDLSAGVYFLKSANGQRQKLVKE